MLLKIFCKGKSLVDGYSCTGETTLDVSVHIVETINNLKRTPHIDTLWLDTMRNWALFMFGNWIQWGTELSLCLVIGYNEKLNSHYVWWLDTMWNWTLIMYGDWIQWGTEFSLCIVIGYNEELNSLYVWSLDTMWNWTLFMFASP